MLLKLQKLHSENWDIIAKNISGNYSVGQLENKFQDLQEKNIEIIEHKIQVEGTVDLAEEWDQNEESLVKLQDLFPQNWDMVGKNLAGNVSAKEARSRYLRLNNIIPEVSFFFPILICQSEFFTEALGERNKQRKIVVVFEFG